MRYFGSIICPELTDRKVQIAMLISQFKTNKEIAKELGMARITVCEHITEMFETLGLESRMQLVIWMLKRGLINLEDIELPTKDEEKPS
jgi:Response regulator containing a CheY-like receiver domain and an HTH DNA-binding domain